MKLAPWLDSVPLLVNHEEGARIGRVLSLDPLPLLDGAGMVDWLTAHCELYPDCPRWVERGTPASFGCVLLNQSSFIDGRVYGGIVKEVSLLHGEKPAEPGAQVVHISEPEATLASRSVGSDRGRPEIVHPRGIILRRNCGEILGIR